MFSFKNTGINYEKGNNPKNGALCKGLPGKR